MTAVACGAGVTEGGLVCNHPPLFARQLSRAGLLTWLGLVGAGWPVGAPAHAQYQDQGHILIDVVLCASHCEGVVLRVWDGDTFRIGFGVDSERVRFEHIDAPEIEGRCRLETDLAVRSKLRLAKLLRDRDVTIERRGQDVHGRTLARITVDGSDIGAILVRQGLARIWNGQRESWCR